MLIHQPGDKIASCHTRKKYEITEVGIMHPEETPIQALYPGQVGYIACNMKQSSEGVPGSPLVSFMHWTEGFKLTLVTRSIVSVPPLTQCRDLSHPKLWLVELSYIFFCYANVSQVYAGVFPIDNNDFTKLEESINRVSNSAMLHPTNDSHIGLS